MNQTIAYRTVKGGQGCTTASLVHALKYAVQEDKQTLLLTSSMDDVAAMLNVVINEDGGISYGNLEVLPLEWGITPGWEKIVIDVGTSTAPYQSNVTVLITRNCYLSLRRAAPISEQFASVLLIEEPGRPLMVEDVRALFDCKVIPVKYDPAMARIVDSGLVGLRVPA